MKKILKGLGVFVLSAVMVGVFSLPVMAAQAPTGRKYKASGSIKLDMTNGDLEFPANVKGEMKNTEFATAASFGFFLNDMFEIGPEIYYSSSKDEDEDPEYDDWAGGYWLGTEKETEKRIFWSLGVKANAHFNLNGPVVPCVGLRLALASLGLESKGSWAGIEYDVNGNEVGPDSGSWTGIDDSDTSILYGFQVGLDWFLTDHVSINPELRYSMASFKLEINEDGEITKFDIDMDETALMIGFAVHF